MHTTHWAPFPGITSFRESMSLRENHYLHKWESYLAVSRANIVVSILWRLGSAQSSLTYQLLHTSVYITWIPENFKYGRKLYFQENIFTGTESALRHRAQNLMFSQHSNLNRYTQSILTWAFPQFEQDKVCFVSKNPNPKWLKLLDCILAHFEISFQSFHGWLCFFPVHSPQSKHPHWLVEVLTSKLHERIIWLYLL